jgi:hypothetical protein
MTRFDLEIQRRLVEVPLPPRLLQLPHFIILQPSSDDHLQLFPTNLGLCLLLFRSLQPRFEARLHTYAER